MTINTRLTSHSCERHLPILAPTSTNNSLARVPLSFTDAAIQSISCITLHVGRKPRALTRLIMLIPFFKSWSVCPVHMSNWALGVIKYLDLCLHPFSVPAIVSLCTKRALDAPADEPPCPPCITCGGIVFAALEPKSIHIARATHSFPIELVTILGKLDLQ